MARKKDGDLAFHAYRRAADQGPAVFDAGAIHGKTGVKIVAAIEYHARRLYLFFKPDSLQASGERGYAYIGVDRRQSVLCRRGFLPADIILPVQDLPLQVGQFDDIVIGNHQLANTGSRQINGCWRTQATGTDNQDPRREQFFLTCNIHLRQHDLPTVTQ